MPLAIDIIGDLGFEDLGMEEEADRRFRTRRDPTKDYMLRDPRNPERYPNGSGGEVNYGLRIREFPDEPLTQMGVRAGGGRASLAPSQDDFAVLADLGFFNFNGIGYVGDEEVHNTRQIEFRTLEPDFSLGGLEGADEYVLDAIAYDFAETFMTSKYDGIRLGTLGGLKLPKLGDVAKGVSNALKTAGGAVAKAGATAVKTVNDGYKKLAKTMDVNKGDKDKLISQMNRIKGEIAGCEARGLKNPESVKKISALKAEYNKLAQECAKEKMTVDALDVKQREIKAQGVAQVIKVGMQAQAIAKDPKKQAEVTKKIAEKKEEKKLKGLSDVEADTEIAIEYLGIIPLVVGAVAVVGTAVAVGAVLKKLIGNSGKLETKTKEEIKNINKLEEGWGQAVKVPYDPNKDPPQQIVTDPNTGAVIGMRVGDQFMPKTSVSTTEATKLVEQASKQSGNVESEAGKTGLSAGQSFLNKLGIPWYVLVAIGVGGVAVLYVMATSKKKAPPPPQQPPEQQYVPAPAPTGA